jgi:hypothetical protein
VQLTYEDDDGDVITVCSQNDLDQLYDYCHRCQLTKVSVLVTPAPSGDPRSTIPGAVYSDEMVSIVLELTY